MGAGIGHDGHRRGSLGWGKYLVDQELPTDRHGTEHGPRLKPLQAGSHGLAAGTTESSFRAEMPNVGKGEHGAELLVTREKPPGVPALQTMIRRPGRNGNFFP